jgi:hypothetical protein
MAALSSYGPILACPLQAGCQRRPEGDLRGRMIPIPLAWLGVVASVLLVVGLPLQLAGFLGGPVTSLLWLPMAVFEVPLALWLLIKGVATPSIGLRPSF